MLIELVRNEIVLQIHSKESKHTDCFTSIASPRLLQGAFSDAWRLSQLEGVTLNNELSSSHQSRVSFRTPN